MKESKPAEEHLIESDPSRKTYIDEQGRKYWLGTGYHGRTIKHYGEPFKFPATWVDTIGLPIVLGLIVLANLDFILDFIFKFF